jgi:hypothetical protein
MTRMAIEYEQTIHVDTSPDTVWRVYTDVESWPEWTTSMQKIQLVDDGPLALGSKAKVKLRGAPETIFVVTELAEGRSFTWESNAWGLKSVAYHTVRPDGDGSIVTLGVRLSGPLATVLAPLFRSIARRNVGMEATGLKQRCENP